MNYRWQAEILQERAEGYIQVDLQRKSVDTKIMHCGFVGVVFGHILFHLVPVPTSAQTLDIDQSLLSTVLKCSDARSVLLFHLIFLED